MGQEQEGDEASKFKRGIYLVIGLLYLVATLYLFFAYTFSNILSIVDEILSHNNLPSNIPRQSILNLSIALFVNIASLVPTSLGFVGGFILFRRQKSFGIFKTALILLLPLIVFLSLAYIALINPH